MSRHESTGDLLDSLEGVRQVQSNGEGQTAVVDASTDIFVENFDDAYFRAARPAGGGDGSVFHLPIDDLADPGLLRGQTLRLTVVTASAQLVGDVTIE